MARRSRAERARAAIGAWMPLDGRRAMLLATIGLVAALFLSLLH